MRDHPCKDHLKNHLKDRYQSATNFFKFSPLPRLKLLPTWVMLSLATNVVLIALLFSAMRQTAANQTAQPTAQSDSGPSVDTNVDAIAAVDGDNEAVSASGTAQMPGERHQLNYQQWLDQLQQEAKFAATEKPKHLTILAGDSISLWFPTELLPEGRSWLNQGISGETSGGLLKRLHLFEQTQPDTIFVMIGINDLLRGIDDQTLLENQRQIIQNLDQAHPEAQIVVQSILPHARESDWEGRERLLAISNRRIQALNRRLETIARQEGVYFLDLYPLFATAAGDLRPDLTTDGLHLNSRGYQTWSIALQVYSREVLRLDEAD